MSTHDLCFRAKIRKEKCTPVNPNFTIDIKVGCKGVYITPTCLHDDKHTNIQYTEIFTAVQK